MKTLLVSSIILVFGFFGDLTNGFIVPLTQNQQNTFRCASKEFDKDTIIGIEPMVLLPGQIILDTGRKMALDERLIIRGSCWTWVNAVYNRAGFGKTKEIIFKSKLNGPYANLSLIEPGDWLYYINYTRKPVEHSGIFVYWKDFDKKIGVVLSYIGRNRSKPGMYLYYDLKHVYYITRPTDR
jgi:hypothetical protein